jgi:hypothetical protein
MTTFRNPHERIEELMQRVGQLETERDAYRGRLASQCGRTLVLEAILRDAQGVLAEDADLSARVRHALDRKGEP